LGNALCQVVDANKGVYQMIYEVNIKEFGRFNQLPGYLLILW
jgi:hypothetical protein